MSKSLFTLFDDVLFCERAVKRAKQQVEYLLAVEAHPEEDAFHEAVGQYQLTYCELVRVQAELEAHPKYDRDTLDEYRITSQPESTWNPAWQDGRD